MKYLQRPFYLVLVLATTTILSCNNSNSSKAIAKDTSEKKFNPAGDQKTTDTYDPKVTATDTMYKNKEKVVK